MSSCSTSSEELPMKSFPLAGTAVALALTFALVACTPVTDDDAAPATGTQAAATPGVEGIDGLETARQQAGYAIGLELGGTLFPVRDEVDLDAMFDGIRDTVAGNEPKVSEQQFMQIMQDLGERMQVARSEAAAQAAQEGAAFLAENAGRDEVEATASGLQYEVLEPGEGDSPAPGDRVRV